MNVGISDDSMSQATENKKPSKKVVSLTVEEGFRVVWRHGLLRGSDGAGPRNEPRCGIKLTTYSPADSAPYAGCNGDARGKERVVIEPDDHPTGDGLDLSGHTDSAIYREQPGEAERQRGH